MGRALCQSSLELAGVQEEADELKKANQEGKKADLARRVKNFPKHLKEAVAGTPQDEIFINHIGDRHALLTTPTHSPTANSLADLLPGFSVICRIDVAALQAIKEFTVKGDMTSLDLRSVKCSVLNQHDVCIVEDIMPCM